MSVQMCECIEHTVHRHE